MTSRTVRLSTPRAREHAKALIDQAGEGFVAKIAKETRRDAQNRLLWPLIQEIQCQVPEMAPYSAEDIKLRFMDALGSELRFLPKLEGQGVFPVGHRSSTLTVEQFSGLIDLIYKYGAEHGVLFRDPRDD